MSRALVGLDASQKAAVTHEAGPILVVGGPGSGKTHAAAARIAWLLGQGTEPEAVLAVCFSSEQVAAFSATVEELTPAAHAEPSIDTLFGLSERILRQEALEARLDPFFCTLTQADRLSLLLDRIDSFGLGAHEVRGNPASVVAQMIGRIDSLKEQMVTAEQYRDYAGALSQRASTNTERAHARTEERFASLFEEHERLIAASGSLDRSDLINHCFALLHQKAHVRERVTARFSHLLVDDFQDLSFAQGMLLRLLCPASGNIGVFADSDQAIHRSGDLGSKNVADFTREYSNAHIVRLEGTYRLEGQIARAAEALLAAESTHPNGSAYKDAGVRFLRCRTQRAAGQAIAAQIERLLTTEEVDANRICVLFASVKQDGPAVCSALEERSVPFYLCGGDAYFRRSEVRDVLAWLRLLANPDDSTAIVRALSRPPVELNSVDIARVAQLAGRRRLDMVAAVSAACDGPQLSPEGRQRAQGFLRLHRAAAEVFDELQPDSFIHRLIERIELRDQQLFAPQPNTIERLVNIGKLVDLATGFMRRNPGASARDFARHLAAASEAGLSDPSLDAVEAPGSVVLSAIDEAKGREFDHVFVVGADDGTVSRGKDIPQALLKEKAQPNEAAGNEWRRRLYVAMTRARQSLTLVWTEDGEGTSARLVADFDRIRRAIGASEEVCDEDLLGASEGLHSSFRSLRDDVLDSVARVGAGLGEMRLDTYLDVSGAVARFLELIKAAALVERVKSGQSVDEALPELNQLLARGASDDQREALFASPIDDYLREAARRGTPPASVTRATSEPSLQPFLPRRGNGLLLSASDIETYRRCPLKYKFSRVLRIPEEPTVYQRFGIVVHQVLERFHANEKRPTLAFLMQLFEAAWRRCGFSNASSDRELKARAKAALRRYFELDRKRDSEPVWFERSFSFRLGPHVVRGRVDRVDRHRDGSFELIDYKTGAAKSKSELEDDIQLSLYQMGARRSWQVQTSSQSYYYVLDNEKVFVEHSNAELQRVRKAVEEIAASILAENFEPKPSREICSMCDYRLICPAAER